VHFKVPRLEGVLHLMVHVSAKHYRPWAQGTLVAERPSPGGKPESAAVTEGSLVSCAAYLSSTRTSIAVRAAEVRRTWS